MICSLDYCDRAVAAKGLCDPHYRQVHIRGREPVPVKIQKRRFDCSVVGCKRQHYAHGFCQGRWARWYRGKSLDGEFKVNVPHDGRWREYSDSQGYVSVTRKIDGVIERDKKHRVVMSEFLGRKLSTNENVHHINGNRMDNRIENLELWSTSQPAGQRVSDKTAWAKEWLRMYEPEALA